MRSFGLWNASALGVVLVACLAPWPFAAVEPFWWSLACALTLAIAVPALVIGHSAPSLPRAARWAAWLPPAVALGSIVPIPGRLVELLSPASQDVLRSAGVDVGDGWRTLSLFAPAGFDSLILIGSCVATAWLVAHAARGPDARALLSRAFVAGGVAIALFGLAQRLIDPDPQRMFWSIEIYEVGTPFGPYVNRNHFGGAMLLFVGVASGRALAARAAGHRHELVAMTAAAGLCALALVGTTSRGAILGLIVLAGVLLLAMPGRGRLRLGAVLAIAALLLTGGLLVTGLFDELAGRLFSVYGRWRNRFLVQEDALRVASRFPLCGTGAGTFAWVYSSFQTVDDVRQFNDAHSDWVQIVMDTGLAGLVAVLAVLRALWHAARRALATAVPSRWHALGPVAGCAGLCAHGFVETNLHIPANALLTAVVAGLAYGSSLESKPTLDSQLTGEEAEADA